MAANSNNISRSSCLRKWIDFDGIPIASSLIDTEKKQWRINMVERLFLPNDITTILSILLGHGLLDDSIIWVVMKHDNFSVKSAYPIALDILEGKHEGKSSNGDPNKPVWKKVWMLQIYE